MAAALPQDHVKALDQLRTRLSQLASSMSMLMEHLQRQDPLPSWPTLQADATTLGSNLADLADTLNSQTQLFTSMHAYPLPNFPAVTQEMMLQGILRKRLDPAAQDWIEASVRETNTQDQNGKAEDAELSIEDMHELWEFARSASRDILAPLVEDGSMEDDYTIAEREGGIEDLITGVKRIDEVDEDVEMEQDNQLKQNPALKGADLNRPAVILESILRFTSGNQKAGELAL